ncbi:hypothetical protein [Leptospira ainlahdjerensis]|nr:hypothetical protein [Leptospira ainlahdjerensis]
MKIRLRLALDVSGDGVSKFIRVLGDRNGQYFSKLDLFAQAA